MNKSFIILDLEATCWDKLDAGKPSGFRNEIIEIGAVRCDAAGTQLDQFSAFLKPKKHPIVSAFCTELTTITQADIDAAEDAKAVLARFFEWSKTDGADVKYVSWGHYDKRQLRDDLQLNGLDKDLINDGNHYSLKHLHSEWNNLKRPKGIGLGGACKFEKIEFTGTAHRGICDAINIAKIFKKYANRF